jgi:hypothetical protein
VEPDNTATKASRMSAEEQLEALHGWEEIADYLHQSVRTVQLWEREFGLPVHRPREYRRYGVVAFAGELDEWSRRTHAATKGASTT